MRPLRSSFSPSRTTAADAIPGRFPARRYVLRTHLDGLPVNLRSARPWKSLTWEAVLDAYAASDSPWVSTTAHAWRTQLASLVPAVDATTVWNDVPNDAPGMELALRARVAWLSRQMDSWCSLDHDLVLSSGGGNWAVRMWASASTPQHFVTAEIQEGMTAYEWKPDPGRPYRHRLIRPTFNPIWRTLRWRRWPPPGWPTPPHGCQPPAGWKRRRVAAQFSRGRDAVPGRTRRSR